MATTTNLPNSPTTWQTLASSFSIPKLPYKSASSKDSDMYVERDFYYDISKLPGNATVFQSVYSDIVAFNATTATINVPNGGAVCLYTRVITSPGPLTINVVPGGTSSSVLVIYASKLDQPVTIKSGNNPSVALNIGGTSGNVGVEASLGNGKITLDYKRAWDSLEVSAPELSLTLNTQLRIASILYWLKPAVAGAIATHVGLVTARSVQGAMLNINANSIGQQLTASVLTGPGVNYAPVLTLDAYKRTLQDAIDTAAAYEDQYNRFSDRKTSVQDQLAAFDLMIAKAQDVLTFQSTLATEASGKWSSACDTLIRADSSLRMSQLNLEDKEATFKGGLEAWKILKTVEADFQMILAVVTFAAAIGEICVGDPAAATEAPAQVEKAVTAVTTVAKTASRNLTADNLTKLKASVKASIAMFDSTTAVVQMVDTIQGASSNTITPLSDEDDVMGRYGMDDIVALAAWDSWALEADQQMEFAISEGINGASEYRLELRKHTVEGRLVTQARAQAIKAGQEYSNLQLSVQMAQRDLDRLKAVRGSFQSQSDGAEQARASFFDKLMMIRTGVLIQMRKAALAYKYMSLSSSKVNLDPLRSIADLRADALLITQEVERWQEQSSSDFSPFTPAPLMASELSPVICAEMIASFKKSATATFTLSPSTTTGAGTLAISGPFTDGSRFRIQGMRVYLVGAKVKTPAANGTGAVTLTISTSGMYADILQGAVVIFNMLPLSRNFKYNLAAGSNGDTGTSVVIDSIIPSQNYVDPTPFTQWTLTIKQPELLDLSGLRDVKFVWQGTARFNA